jgi:hypothetical protein
MPIDLIELVAIALQDDAVVVVGLGMDDLSREYRFIPHDPADVAYVLAWLAPWRWRRGGLARSRWRSIQRFNVVDGLLPKCASCSSRNLGKAHVG